MTSHLFALCFGANDPLRLARFWAGVLGWMADPHDGIALLPSDDTGFRIRFLSTQERKAGPNRMHLDLTSTSLQVQQQTVTRSLGLGARHIDIGQRPEEGHVVLVDPEGMSSASSSRATTSSPTADSSERLRATARRRSGTSGAKRWGGRWFGIRTRRPRSARCAAVPKSPGAVRH